MKWCIAMLMGLSACFSANAQTTTPYNQAPAWSREAIWYQVFVERFYNGDKANDPQPANINIPAMGQIAPNNWTVNEWTGDWYGQQGWEAGRSAGDNMYYRRYGGDLQGVLDKLDYLQDLGITALFMNPLNDAPSAHKYDARSYHHIDVNFGPDPDGDNRIIANENPADPATWQWTAADKLFLKLIDEAHKRGMRIIMDYSWNHTGVLFWAWQDVVKNQSASACKDWYDIKSFNDPASPGNEFNYNGWAGLSSLPEIKKVNITTRRINGRPYEGNINEGAKKHIMDVTKRWLAPNGRADKGIDGFRLDVADQIGLGFWRDFRKTVRQVKPDAYLVGEVWWTKWPDSLMNPVPYTRGDVFDAVMFYQVYKPARYFFAKTDFGIDAAQLMRRLSYQWNRLPTNKRYAMMNVSSTHDTPRLLTDFYNTNKYKYQAKPSDNPSYKTGKPDEQTYQRLRLYLAHLFTSIGAPQIWNGEEMGMWGADDPDPRKPLWWQEYAFADETRTTYQPGPKQYDKVGFNPQQFNWYKKLITIRKNNPVLVNGGIKFITAKGGRLVYKRYDAQNEILVCFNLEKATRQFKLPAGALYINLLTDEVININVLALGTLQAAILKRIK